MEKHYHARDEKTGEPWVIVTPEGAPVNSSEHPGLVLTGDFHHHTPGMGLPCMSDWCVDTRKIAEASWKSREPVPTPSEEHDIINHPDHYHKGGIDVIGFCEQKLGSVEMEGFYRVNAIKYLIRYSEKGKPREDLEKARFYINKLIDMYKESATP